MPSGSNIEIVDNLTSTDTDKALSANQGKILDNKISTLSSEIKDDLLDGHKFKWLTQVEYDSLNEEEKNNPLIEYHITDASSENGCSITFVDYNGGGISIDEV